MLYVYIFISTNLGLKGMHIIVHQMFDEKDIMCNV